MHSKFRDVDLSFVGFKKNRLTVVKLIKKHGRTYFECVCDCGNLKDIKMSHFKSERIKSCGCLNIEKLKARKGYSSKLLKPNNLSAKKRLYSKYKKEAFKRNLCFKIDIDSFTDLTEENCHYCGIEPNKVIKHHSSRSKHTYNGIDRVDNNKGYSLDNCVPCCTQCNQSKNKYSLGDFERWLLRIFNHNKKLRFTPKGSTVAFDVDDTLVCWNTPKGMEDKEVEIVCEGKVSYRVPNVHNINLLKKFSESGHVVVVWSASGVQWSKAVVDALDLNEYVDFRMSKTSYYIDDIEDPSKILGKHGFFDIEGNRFGYQKNFKNKVGEK